MQHRDFLISIFDGQIRTHHKAVSTAARCAVNTIPSWCLFRGGILCLLKIHCFWLCECLHKTWASLRENAIPKLAWYLSFGVWEHAKIGAVALHFLQGLVLRREFFMANAFFSGGATRLWLAAVSCQMQQTHQKYILIYLVVKLNNCSMTLCFFFQFQVT